MTYNCNDFNYWSAPNFVRIGGGALRVKISRGARLEVQNGTQQDLNEIIDLVNFGGKKIVYMLKIGGFRNGTQQDLNKMVDMVKFWGAKRSSRCRKWGAKPRRIPTDSQRGSAPPRDQDEECMLQIFWTAACKWIAPTVRVCSMWWWNGVGEIPKPNQPIVRLIIRYHANYYCDKV